jgi:hypothetical protein
MLVDIEIEDIVKELENIGPTIQKLNSFGIALTADKKTLLALVNSSAKKEIVANIEARKVRLFSPSPEPGVTVLCSKPIYTDP